MLASIFVEQAVGNSLVRPSRETAIQGAEASQVNLASEPADHVETEAVVHSRRDRAPKQRQSALLVATKLIEKLLDVAQHDGRLALLDRLGVIRKLGHRQHAGLVSRRLETLLERFDKEQL